MGGAVEELPALMDLHKRFPTAKWIYFCDDDTYLFTYNLLTALAKYNPDQEYYIGLYWTPRIDMEWKEAPRLASGGQSTCYHVS